MKTYTKAERKAALKMIDEYFYRLERVCESTEKWDRYLELHRQEEKTHSHFIPDHATPGLTHKQAIRLFAVKEIMEHVAGTAYPVQAKEFFHIKKSVFGAAAMWDLKRDVIASAFTTQEAQDYLASVDYAELNKDQRNPAQA